MLDDDALGQLDFVYSSQQHFCPFFFCAFISSHSCLFSGDAPTLIVNFSRTKILLFSPPTSLLLCSRLPFIPFDYVYIYKYTWLCTRIFLCEYATFVSTYVCVVKKRGNYQMSFFCLFFYIVTHVFIRAERNFCSLCETPNSTFFPSFYTCSVRNVDRDETNSSSIIRNSKLTETISRSYFQLEDF